MAKVCKKSYKYCIVPLCTNTAVTTPDKVFITLPSNQDMKRRRAWLVAIGRNPGDFSNKTTTFLCEDHFNLEHDVTNYIKFKYAGGPIHIKEDVVPHVFLCQPGRKRTDSTYDRPASIKRARLKLIEDLITDETQNTEEMEVENVLCELSQVTNNMPFSHTRRTMELPKIKLEHEFLEEPQTFKQTEVLEEKCNSADEIMAYRNLCIKSETVAEEIHIKDEPPTNLVESFTESDCTAAAHLNSLSSNTTRAEMTTFKCKFCPLTFMTKRLLDGHELTHMRKYSGEKPFKCFACGRKCPTKEAFIIHIRTHMGEKPFERFTWDHKYAEGDLVKHMKTHKGEKPFKCAICSHKFERKSSLVKHIGTHTGEKSLFECITCGRQFARKYCLTMHVKKHTGEKPFECSICGYEVAVKGDLVKHIRTHTGEKPFKCVTCGHTFAAKGSLVKHIRTHTGEKPFKCVTCGHEFAAKGALIRHIRTHTEEKAFKCVTCGRKFARKDHLTGHVKKHTREKPSECVT